MLGDRVEGGWSTHPRVGTGYFGGVLGGVQSPEANILPQRASVLSFLLFKIAAPTN